MCFIEQFDDNWGKYTHMMSWKCDYLCSKLLGLIKGILFDLSKQRIFKNLILNVAVFIIYESSHSI